jgi:hypothetical protein
MRSSLLLRSRILPLVVALAIVALTTACDATGETGSDTIVLNDAANPTVVTYEFEYNPAQAVGGEVGVTSSNTDNLSSTLSAYGRNRSDVVSARVESITILQSTGGSVAIDKLFPYVQNVALYLGNSDSGTTLAEPQPVSSGLQADLTATGNDVTATVQSGPSPAFLVIDVDDTNESQGFIEAEVEYEIRVPSE